MPTLQPLTRLLYKELRESWLIVFVLFVMPAVVVTLDQHRRSAFVDGLVMFTWFLMPALVVAWALSKSDVKSGGKRPFSGGLPVRPMVEWLTSTILPILLMLPVGYWVAWWQSIASPNTDAGGLLLSSGLAYTAMFSTALVVARLTSIWVGLAAALGAVGLVSATPYWDQENAWHTGVIVSMLGLSLIQVVARKKTAKARGALSAGWLMAIIAIPIIATWNISRQSLSDWSPTTNRAVMINNTCTVDYREVPGRKDQQLLMATPGGPPGFGERNTRVTRTRVFPLTARVVSAFGDTVYILRPGGALSRRARLLAWDLNTDGLRDVCILPTDASAIQYSDSEASISIDGTQMIIILPSLLGRYGMGQVDLWLVDLQTGKRVLCESDTRLEMRSVGWNERNATIASHTGLVSIDRRTGRTTTPAIPAVEAKQ